MFKKYKIQNPQELVNKTINLHLKSLNKIKTAGPEKCSITLLLLYVNVISKYYYSAKPRVIFKSRPMIKPGANIRHRNVKKEF